MPELPEVETIVNELNREIRGKKIQKIKINLPKIVRGDVKKAEELVIQNVRRRAKLIIVELSGSYNLAIHLKLTGQLFFIPAGELETKTGERENKFTHVIFEFIDGSKLLFNDLRQFGYVKILTTTDLENELKKENYGPEPLEREFTVGYLKELFSRRKKSQIKTLLLDQKAIAGIGNIYSDEVLFLARISPKRRVGEITDEETRKLYKAIKKVLKEALKYQGTSINMYRKTTGEKGAYENHLRVYQRDGEKCQGCPGEIVRIKFGSRSARYCPSCQK
jgi:formamidopyrimidine-DNA glycosylase